jgi:putative ABC transport system substrate-binding protein
VIFEVGFNPVDFGLVSSLARPGGNLTGISGLNIDVVGKRLELLHELYQQPPRSVSSSIRPIAPQKP